MHPQLKMTLLLVFVGIALCVWMPRGAKTTGEPSPDGGLKTVARQAHASNAAPAKRTTFADWGRNPFAGVEAEGPNERIDELRLLGIMQSTPHGGRAFINDSIVQVGDPIAGRIVKRINRDSVVLVDGTKETVLKLDL